MEIGRFSSAARSANRSGTFDRSVKIIAKMPAKNINSLPSHTMVPTATMLGRSGGAGALLTDASEGEVDVATQVLWTSPITNTPHPLARVAEPCCAPYEIGRAHA